MSKQALKFNDIEVNKKEVYDYKQAILLNSVNKNDITISYNIKHSDDSYIYFFGYSHDNEVIRHLCIILPQISGYIKYFDKDGKNTPFKIF